METDAVLTITLCGSPEEARAIREDILKKRLAACVNILPEVDSRYWWENKLESARETMLMAKTTRARLPALIKAIEELHSYEVPEIIALPVISGQQKYLQWLADSTRA